MGQDEISRQTIQKAVREANAHEFMRRLQDGFYHKIAEGGSTLSAGQRQLLSFVSALTYQPKVLILDEATSSVVPETERLIQEANFNLKKNLLYAYTSSIVNNLTSMSFKNENLLRKEGDDMLKKEKKPGDDKGFSFDKNAGQKDLKPIPGSATSAEKTVIGERISIDGNIRGDEHLIIEGSMKGNVEMEMHNFAVGPKGRVEGEINAQSVRISGQMIGNLKTKGEVEITKEADFMGDIKAKSVSIEDGAYFKGSIELKSEPHRKAASTGESTALKTSQPIYEPKPPTTKVADEEN